MPLSPADQALLANMKQREVHIKKRRRAADSIRFEARRYRGALVFSVAVAVVVVVAGLYFEAMRTVPDRSAWWLPTLVTGTLAVIVGVELGQAALRSHLGRRLLARNEKRLREKYSGDLHAGRRWLQFYYQDEDISAYVRQILYFIEEERRFDSVHEALVFAKKHHRESTMVATRALDSFEDVAAQTNLLVVSSADESGRSSGRIMRFVKSERPGVWYVTTAPEGTKVREFDRGRVAVVTPPTTSGATISSNRVVIKRAEMAFPAVAELYRAQVPGYLDGMTEDEQEREVVYEVSLQSAKVDTWLDHDVVEF